MSMTPRTTILVVDIETTGFNLRDDCITEVGVVLVDLFTGEIKEVYNEVVKESHFGKHHAKAWIFENGYMRYEEVENAKDLDRKSLQDLFDKYYATAYNKEFDFDFLRSRGLKIKELDCPMRILTDICKIPHQNGFGYKWPKVQEAWDFLFPNTDYVEKHRGLDDAHHEAKIIIALYRMGYFKVGVLE